MHLEPRRHPGQIARDCPALPGLHCSGMNEHSIVLPTDYDEAEREALAAAVTEARADPRPGIPHEQVRAEMLREIERLRRKIAADPGR